MNNTLTYENGVPLQLGDHVSGPGNNHGIIVFVIESSAYAPDFPVEDWRHLGSGFMVREENGTLIHYPKSDPCIQLISRAQQGAQPDAGTGRKLTP